VTKIFTISFIPLAEANGFVALHHRHHKPVVGHKFSMGLFKNDKLCGVVIVGRPVNRYLAKYGYLEVSRLCTDGTKNACSRLYAAAWREAKKRGYTKIVTYILESEPGTSLKAAGWTFTGYTKGSKWSYGKRHREDKAPTCKKKRFERVI
jgi:hypothetical protein